jgi:hypothetical protein
MKDPASRRRLAYPIVTLCVAALIWLFSTGRISVDPPVEPEVYEKFATEVVAAAREGTGPLVLESDFVSQGWRSIAPEALRERGGGAFRARFVDPSADNDEIVRDALAGMPVEVRLTEGRSRGRGVYLYVRFVDGAASVVGVGALTPDADSGGAEGAAAGSVDDGPSTDPRGTR